MLSGSALYQDSVFWRTEGDGSFDDPQILTPVYTPGTEDINKGYAWLRLTAYDSIPCSGSNTDRVKVIIDECTGISELNGGGLTVSVVPNPATSWLNFQVSGIEASDDLTLTLINTQGVTVFTMKIPSNNSQYNNAMDITRFPKGIYYLKAGNREKQVIQKVILQ
jgi:hypothetical protein